MNSEKFDFLVIGSGIAGLFSAIKASEKGTVALVTKRELFECNSVYAQGGISCVMEGINEKDSFASHIQDTLEAGAGLCKEEAVKAIVNDAPSRIQDLINLGVNFTTRGEVENGCSTEEAAEYDLGKEGGHSRRRVLHAGDVTGEELIRALVSVCKNNPKINVFENHHAIDLITTERLGWGEESNQCLGAYILDVENDVVKTFHSKVTVLATGGAGKVYLYTTNPDIATGDGVAMAYRANAQVSNMEFFQFHPTCLYHHEIKSFLISEAVRGEGAVLKVKKKNKYVEFMDKYHELKSLAPRDIVARAIDRELKESGEKCVYLDITNHDAEYLQKRFPSIYEKCLSLGLDMSKDLIPVVPAAHYCCGGINTDIKGRTSLERLYAVGEAASTGLHGANRLASNSLMEAVVMANNAIDDSSDLLAKYDGAAVQAQRNAIPDWSRGNATDSDELVVITHNWSEIRSFMWDYVGIFRTTKRLQRAKRRIRTIQQEINHYYWNFVITPDLIELRNLAGIAELIIDSALSRKESRGLHYNVDFPNKSNSAHETIIRRR
ncbi:MAG: L-aspartate oxidase [Lentisphaeraceae bacterium]|nr:L-aspartate oxidase [Lentisphaeraceae bacterium]